MGERWKRGEELIDHLYAKNNEEALDIARSLNKEAAEQLEFILENCSFAVNLELHLVRGLSYYTGPIYEIKVSNEVGTVMAGGRYDRLLAQYGRDAPAVGISVGVDRLATLLEGGKKTHVCLFIASFESTYSHAFKVAEELRAAGVAVETDLHERNLKKQFEYANALKIPYVLVVGEKEVKSGKYTLKNMESGEERLLSLEEVIAHVRGACCCCKG